MELTEGFVELLEGFRPVFQLQTFPIFVELMTGWVLSPRRRFVTDLIVSSGSVGKRHFSDYHRFFSQYVWELDLVSKTLFLLLVRVWSSATRSGRRRRCSVCPSVFASTAIDRE